MTSPNFEGGAASQRSTAARRRRCCDGCGHANTRRVLAESVGANGICYGGVRFMSKYLSKSATKRVPLSSKRARKGYYKGNGGTKEGHITSKGRFIVDFSKRLEIVMPRTLEGFQVSLSEPIRELSSMPNPPPET
eukprot:scaffold384011_cov31-Attheya_sp.AAC.1